MSLNIKNEEAHRLAAELAELTGASMTQAVVVALREQVAKARKKEEAAREKRLKEIDEITRRSAALIRAADPHATSQSMQDELYDEDGLPV